MTPNDPRRPAPLTHQAARAVPRAQAHQVAAIMPHLRQAFVGNFLEHHVAAEAAQLQMKRMESIPEIAQHLQRLQRLQQMGGGTDRQYAHIARWITATQAELRARHDASAVVEDFMAHLPAPANK